MSTRLFFLIAMILWPSAAQAQLADLVNRMVAAIASGNTIAELEGIPTLSESSVAALADLEGCSPSLRSDSSKSWAHVEFLCEPEGEQSYKRTITMQISGETIEQLHVTPQRIAVGPSATALTAGKLPSRRKMFATFQDAIAEGEDTTLNGVVPLMPEQERLLAKLTACNWERVTVRQTNEEAGVAMCRSVSGRSAYMVRMTFDNEDRPLSVDVSGGSVIKRPAGR